MRRDRVRDLLLQNGSLQVTELARLFAVTTMTVRRDLATMECEGALLRTHGGCVLQASMVREAPFAEKIRRRAPQKAAITRAAVQRLEAGQSIYMDTGTTMLHVARQLQKGVTLQVCTSNLRVAIELFGRTELEVVVLGGTLGRKSPDLAGPIPVRALDQVRFGVALLGADAIDPARRETYAADLPSAELARAAMARASRVMLLADSSKFGGRGMAVVGKLGPGMVLITDQGISRTDLRNLRKSGVEVVVVAA